MMIYDIRLVIEYDYARPAAEGRHLLHLAPMVLPGLQRVIRSQIKVVPKPVERLDYTDFFGNSVVAVTLPAGHDAVTFEAISRVERADLDLGLDLSSPLPALRREIADVWDLGPLAPHHYLGPSPRIALAAEISDYARAATAKGATVLDIVRTFGQTLYRDMRFDAKATTVDTPLLDAFRQREGVCQDFAQVMIAGLRGLGIPAGYVSGFLRTIPPPGKARLEGADAMHAWVRAWCGADMGWVEYDPTNACAAGQDHVTVALGRDYGDVAPVAGILRIAGGQSSTQSVDMIPEGEI